MNRFFVLVMSLFLLCGCGAFSSGVTALDASITVSNTSAQILDAAQVSAVSLYRTEQLQALETARAAGEDRDKAWSRIKNIRVNWDPVWHAFATARAAHADLVLALAVYQKDKSKIEELRAALYGFEQAVKAALSTLNTKRLE